MRDISLAFISLYFFYFFSKEEEEKKNSRSLTMHVECALVSFVGGGAVPGKRQDWHRSALPPERIIQVSIIIITIFFFFFFFVTQSGSDAATCHWARWSTGHNLVWKKEKKSHFTCTWT